MGPNPGFRTLYSSSNKFMNLPQSSGGKKTYDRDFSASGLDKEGLFNTARIQYRSQAQLQDLSPVKDSSTRVVEALPSLKEPGLVSGKTGTLLSLRNLAPGGRSRQLYQSSVQAALSANRKISTASTTKPRYTALTVKPPSNDTPTAESLTPRVPEGPRSPARERPLQLRRGHSAPAMSQEKGPDKTDSKAEFVSNVLSSTYTLRHGAGFAQGFNSTWPASGAGMEKMSVSPLTAGTPIRPGTFKNCKSIQGVYFF
mmetsp:Transcript_7077/g.11414  ORF Transcript_7077/g.11414 Transcript_7077/m.11414 type:complete len:256 (+) Transcript_7077:118-885(+)